MGLWQPRERRTCRIEERMGAHGNKRTHCLPRLCHPPQCCATLTPSPLSLSRPRRKSEPQQPAMKTLTHRLPRREEREKKKIVDEEERAMCRGNIYSVYSAKQTGRYYTAALITLLSFTVKFQIRGFSLLTFMVISKPACFLPSHPFSKM